MYIVRAYREQRPYRCEQCDVGFKLRVHLKKHNLYRHSDLYQCECRHCGKRFKDSSAVRLHERIHSTDRPFPCPTCGKTFKTRENLWGHRHRGPCGLLLNQVTEPIYFSVSSSPVRAPGAVFVRMHPICFLAGCRKSRLNRVRFVLLGLVFGVSCVYLFGCCRFALLVP